MTASGLATVRQALPLVAWANVGSTLLVFVAVLDVHWGVLYLLGISGTAFSFSKETHWKILWGVVLGTALLFFGLDQIKSTAGELQNIPWFQTVLQQAQQSFAISFLGGVILSFLTQSSTAATFIAIALIDAGLLDAAETMMLIYGGNLGSSFSRMILASGLKGSSRQIGHFQDLFKITGAIFFVLLFYVELYGRVPLVRTLTAGLAANLGTQMALVNLLFNLVTAVGLSLLLRPTRRVLDYFWPATAEEDFARVQYLHPQALNNPETALDLVDKEEMRLVLRLPNFLDLLRLPPSGKRRADYGAWHQSFALVAREVESYCTALVHQPLGPETSERLTNVRNRLEVIGAIEDCVYQLVTAVTASPPSPRLEPLVQNFVEALDFILLQAVDAAASLDGGEAELLAGICSDRGELMGRIRNAYLSSEEGLALGDKALLFNLTTLFDRTVWTVRRLALLLEQNRRYQE
jgi:phosphate:Na+ symporter